MEKVMSLMIHVDYYGTFHIERIYPNEDLPASWLFIYLPLNRQNMSLSTVVCNSKIKTYKEKYFNCTISGVHFCSV